MNIYTYHNYKTKKYFALAGEDILDTDKIYEKACELELKKCTWIAVSIEFDKRMLN